MNAEYIDVECELAQYIATALWCSYDPGGGNLDEFYGREDIAPESIESMRADLLDFLNHADMRALVFWEAELGAGQIGHDFWLTRNRHGAGFWDRFSAGVGASFGQHLTEQSHPYGESILYVGDDGRLYVS